MMTPLRGLYWRVILRSFPLIQLQERSVLLPSGRMTSWHVLPQILPMGIRAVRRLGLRPAKTGVLSQLAPALCKITEILISGPPEKVAAEALQQHVSIMLC